MSIYKDKELIEKANKELAFDLKQDQPNIHKEEAKAAKIDAKNIKNEYELTARIIERTVQINSNLRENFINNVFVYHNIIESGPEGVSKIVAAHLEPYLNTLSKEINNKGFNKEIINIFKDNIGELAKESSHLYDKREEIYSSLKKEELISDTAVNLKNKESKEWQGWKVISELLGDKSPSRKDAIKPHEKIAEKLIDKTELANISKALKDAGMKRVSKNTAPVILVNNKSSENKSR